MISPVLHKMITGEFKEAAERRLELDEADERTLRQAAELACGHESDMDITAMLQLGIFADRYEMVEVMTMVEEAILQSVTKDTCGDVLYWTGGAQLLRVVSAARRLALGQFDTLRRSGIFTKLSEDMLCDLLGDDQLVPGYGGGHSTEDAVLQAVAAWIRGGDEEGRGERVLREVIWADGDGASCGGGFKGGDAGRISGVSPV